MATCFDEPGVIFDTRFCLDSISKNVKGAVKVVGKLATAYENDGLQRGVHAGDFVWTGQHVQIKGRMSGITNAGILRAPVFKPACEECSTPGVMIGRLCGQVVGSAGTGLNGAQVMAVYRLLTKPTKTGASGPLTGTLEGVIVGPCK